MLGVLSHTRVLRLAGLFTWVMVGLPLAYSQFENLHSRGDMGGWAVLLFVAYLSFGVPAVIAGLLASAIGLHATVLGYGTVVAIAAGTAAVVRARSAR